MTVGLDLDLAFGHHLLALPDDVGAVEVEALAGSWFPRATWLAERSLQLAAEVVLTGPWSVADGDRGALHLPADGTQVFLLRCPVQRGGPPPAELVHDAGLTGAFREGVPVGVEAEALGFLLAAARRLGGALRVAGSGAVLRPDPDADVNLWVHSPVWLDPAALLVVCRPVVPSLRLAVEPEPERAGGTEGSARSETAAQPETAGQPAVAAAPEPATEPEDAAERATPVAPQVAGSERLDAGERAWLHAEASAFDEVALAQPPVLRAYGAVADLDDDGMLEIAVEGEEVVPLVLQGLDWAQHGVVVYLLRWWPRDESALADTEPSEELRAMRARVRALVERTAVALHTAAGGEITDESGFLVDPATLG